MLATVITKKLHVFKNRVCQLKLEILDKGVILTKKLNIFKLVKTTPNPLNHVLKTYNLFLNREGGKRFYMHLEKSPFS